MTINSRVKVKIQRFILCLFVAALIAIGAGQSSHTVTLADDGSVEFGLTIQMLDAMPTLPGELAALPAVLPGGSKKGDDMEWENMFFFEPRLSLDKSLSCASCHDPAKGFADGKALATGFAGKELKRHSPTVLNSA